MNITIRPATESDFPEILAQIRDFATFEKLPEEND